jgi:hypothetical protein
MFPKRECFSEKYSVPLWLGKELLTPINLENLQSKLTTNAAFNRLLGKKQLCTYVVS